MKQYDWDLDERFSSNSGHGPLRARILCVADGSVFMERWNSKSPTRRKRFDLPSRLFFTGRTGWRRVPVQQE